jgi:hypothetical protein
MLRISTTVIFLLLGVGAYMVAAEVGAGTARAILQSVGGFLIGTVVVSYAYQYYLGEETENRTVAKLDSVLEQRVDDIFPGAARYGFNGFAKEIPRTVFTELGAGDELLWLDTYSPDLRLFVPQLREAVGRGAHLRMLVIDPDAQTARLRAAEIAEAGYEADSFREDTRDFLAILSKAAEELSDARGELEIRCYTDLPCVPMYLRLRDRQAITGVTGYFLSEPSFDTVHIKWSSTPTGILAGFQRYFEHKWEVAGLSMQTG